MYYYEIYANDRDIYLGDFKLKSPNKYTEEEVSRMVSEAISKVNSDDLNEILNQLLIDSDFEAADHEFTYVNITELLD